MPAIRLEPGDTFAGYLIEQKLGSGGMGAVYRVRHPALKKDFALKILLESVSDDPSFAERFRREMETVSQLDHPNIVSTVDGGSSDGQIWFAMNYVSGTDAQNALAEHPGGLAPELVVQIVEKVGAALDHAHRKGVVHRDIKPANILLAKGDSGPRVYLTDFGIAKAMDEIRPLTSTGLGPMTIDYASPEQILGEDLDGRSDVYSLGATMFVLLTGRVPFPAPSVPAKMIKHLEEQAPFPSAVNHRLPPGFDAVVTRAMAKNRGARYQHCREMAAAAKAALEPPSVHAPPARADPPATWSSSPAPPTMPAPIVPVPFIPPDRTAGATPTTQSSGTPTRVETIAPPTPRGRHRMLIPVLAGVLVVALGGFFLYRFIDGPAPAGPVATSSSSLSAQTSIASNAATETPAAQAISTAPGEQPASSPAVASTVTPLSDLLVPAPQRLSGTVNGRAVAGAPAYRLQPRGCPDGSREIAVDLSQGFGRITGNVQLDDAAPADMVTAFSASSDATVLTDATLTTTTDASFDIPVPDSGKVLITLESLGTGACDQGGYLVFFTTALAYP